MCAMWQNNQPLDSHIEGIESYKVIFIYIYIHSYWFGIFDFKIPIDLPKATDLVPSSQDVAADPVAFNVLLAEAQNAQEALRLLERMGDLALRPTLVTLNSGAWDGHSSV